MPNVIIRPASSDADLDEVRRLFRAYADSLDFSLCFQDFDAELADLPGKYTGAKRGCLLLGLVDGRALGVVGLRDLGEGIAEMKRLYVAPEARGLKLGLQLAEAVIEEARMLGYQALRLDTLQRMVEANRLYDHLGFSDIPAYYHNPMPDTRYRELKL